MTIEGEQARGTHESLVTSYQSDEKPCLSAVPTRQRMNEREFKLSSMHVYRPSVHYPLQSNNPFDDSSSSAWNTRPRLCGPSLVFPPSSSRIHPHPPAFHRYISPSSTLRTIKTLREHVHTSSSNCSPRNLRSTQSCCPQFLCIVTSSAALNQLNVLTRTSL